MNREEFRALRATLESTLQECLAKAGEKKPAEVTEHIVESTRPGDNPKRVRSMGNKGLPLSTFSEHLTRLHLQGFLYAFNRRLTKEAVQRLHKSPPDDGTILGIIDGHEEPYHYEARKHPKDCRRVACRCHYKLPVHSRNKTSRFAHEWVIFALTWQHGGERVTMPIQARPLLGYGFGPARQVEEFAKLIRRHHVRVSLCLLDRLYDSAEVRAAAARYRLRIGHRIQWKVQGPRYALLASNNQFTTLADLAQEALHHGAFNSWRDRSGDIQVERSIVRTIRFPTDSQEYDLVVAVNVSRARESNQPWRTNRGIAVAVPAGLGPVALRLYRRRWCIESMFHQWALDRNKPRPKTIHAHVVLFCAFLLLKALGAVALLWFHVTWTGPKKGRFLLVSTIEICRWILDAEPDSG